MKYLFIFCFFLTSAFSGAISNTGFYIPLATLPVQITTGMGAINTQTGALVSKFRIQNLEENKLKLKKITQIQTLESYILLELKNITYNQKLLNNIEVVE